MSLDFDVVLFGATGFTGRLVAEHLARRAGADLRWAMAGRDGAKLGGLARALGPTSTCSVLVADAHDLPALRALAERTRVVLTAAGPYRSLGSELLQACADAGTDYVDLAGEADWIRDMIDVSDAAARGSGARVVPCCGFDSVPSELGVSRLQALCRDRWGEPARYVAGRVVDFAAGYSGGTLATAALMTEDAGKDRRVVRLLADPFALTPGFSGPEQPPLLEARWDAMTMGWVAPFAMSGINTKVVHRSNLLAGHAYGRDFRYDEMVVVPGPAREAEARAKAMASADPFAEKGVAPGDGPSADALSSGHFELQFVGEHPAHGRLRLSVRGDREPAYVTSAAIVAEAALCLARDRLPRGGGFWTPITLMGDALVERLRMHAGIGIVASDPASLEV